MSGAGRVRGAKHIPGVWTGSCTSQTGKRAFRSPRCGGGHGREGVPGRPRAPGSTRHQTVGRLQTCHSPSLPVHQALYTGSSFLNSVPTAVRSRVSPSSKPDSGWSERKHLSVFKRSKKAVKALNKPLSILSSKHFHSVSCR